MSFRLCRCNFYSECVMSLCKHWKESNIKLGGSCSIGAFDNPSSGICLIVCNKYEGPKRISVSVSVNKSSRSLEEKQIIDSRKSICSSCEFHQESNEVAVKCSKAKRCCGGMTDFLVHDCPLGKWGNEDAQRTRPLGA